jgi:hypothetical protein
MYSNVFLIFFLLDLLLSFSVYVTCKCMTYNIVITYASNDLLNQKVEWYLSSFNWNIKSYPRFMFWKQIRILFNEAFSLDTGAGHVT